MIIYCVCRYRTDKPSSPNIPILFYLSKEKVEELVANINDIERQDRYSNIAYTIRSETAILYI